MSALEGASPTAQALRAAHEAHDAAERAHWLAERDGAGSSLLAALAAEADAAAEAVQVAAVAHKAARDAWRARRDAGPTRRQIIALTAADEGENMGLEVQGAYYDEWARAYDREQTTLEWEAWLDLPAASDVHGNLVAREGQDRCACGSKYWEQDKCVDCGTHVSEVAK